MAIRTWNLFLLALVILGPRFVFLACLLDRTRSHRRRQPLRTFSPKFDLLQVPKCYRLQIKTPLSRPERLSEEVLLHCHRRPSLRTQEPLHDGTSLEASPNTAASERNKMSLNSPTNPTWTRVEHRTAVTPLCTRKPNWTPLPDWRSRPTGIHMIFRSLLVLMEPLIKIASTTLEHPRSQKTARPTLRSPGSTLGRR